MPLSVRNFSRPYRPDGLREESIEQAPPTKRTEVVRPPPTRNVLKKKPPSKRSARILISAPTDVQTAQSGCVALPSSEQSSAHHTLPSRQVAASQIRRQSHQHSDHAMPLASHPHTMSFVHAPSEVSLPDLSAIPCFNSYSVSHRLKCGHIVRAPTYEACGKNCDSSITVRGPSRPAAKEAFICQACIGNLLDAKYKQKRKRFSDRIRHLWPFLDARFNSDVQKKRKATEEAWEAERAKDERALLRLGRYTYSLNCF